MYKNFFGLRENPFNVNPDPRFLYLTSRTQEALDQLTYGIQNRKGFILLTGEAGTGKTTLINYLLDWLRHQKMSTAFIFNSHLSVNHLFDFMLTDFGVPVDFRLKSNMLMRLNTWLMERFRAGGTPVLIVDEAQGLSFELLEEIRLLLNLETASEKLLQIVLAGQPELEDKLKRPELRQLRQRITLRCNTAPLTLEESHGYITERLRIGGAAGDPVFASDAMEAVHFYSRGIPRVMNLLCEHALINAYVEHLKPVPGRMVEEVAREFLLDEFGPITTRASFSHRINSNLTVMQSIFAKELVPPFGTGGASMHERPHTTRPLAPAAFAVEEPVLAAQNITAAAVPEGREMSAVGEGQKVPVFLNDLISAVPGQEVKQGQRGLCLNSIACTSDTTAQLIAEMKRNPEVASPIPPLHLMEPWGTSWDTLFLPAISSPRWSRVFAAVLRRIRRRIHPAQVLHRWIIEFKRDWNSMVNSIPFPLMNNSALRWLRQSVSSKTVASSRNQRA
jgi:general secretion pathway protein A